MNAMREWSLLIPGCVNAPIFGIRYTLIEPHRVIVRAHTRSEARTAFKRAFGWKKMRRLPPLHAGDLIDGRGVEPSIEEQPQVQGN